MRKVYFDKDYIYVAKFDKIHLSDILKIDERKIEFNDNGETRNIYFFFSSRRRHTRLTCDWSSDVCSSDLHADDCRFSHAPVLEQKLLDLSRIDVEPAADDQISAPAAQRVVAVDRANAQVAGAEPPVAKGGGRSEERRVGKEWRSRRWADH